MDLLGVIGWPILDRIRLGPVGISPHGLGIALGYLAGSWVMLREGKKRGLSEDHIGTILLWALIGAIFGARFFYVVGHLSEFRTFTEMLAIWRGGISLVGGIFGAIAFAYPLMRRYGYRFLQVMDSAAIGLAVGVMIGRVGDLVIGDHLGKPTDFLLGFAYRGGALPGPWVEVQEGVWQASLEGGLVQDITREGARLFGSAGGDPILAGAGVHNTALYDLLLTGGLLLLLLWLNRVPRREGTLILAFGMWYGAGRILTDFLRVDKTWPLGLTGSQWASVGVIAVCLVTLWLHRGRGVGRPPGEPADEEEATAGASDEDRPTTHFTPPPQPRRGGS